MRLFGRSRTVETKEDLDTILRRLVTASATKSGISITPDNCTKSPTVLAIVNAVSRRIAISPPTVYQKSQNSKGRTIKIARPDHPVQQLLNRPNQWQSKVEYWLDASSTLVRWGRFHAWKARGSTGPIRELHPMDPAAVKVEQDDDLVPTYAITFARGDHRSGIPYDRVHTVRAGARNFLNAESPVNEIREEIAAEVAMQQFMSSFFGNGAMPLVSFSVEEGFQGFRSAEEEDSFVDSFQRAYSNEKRLKALLLPKGIKMDMTSFNLEQLMLGDVRKLLRTIIAGAFGVPPHLVGDLERGTFNNVEQQDSDFTINVIMPYVKMFEAALERDLFSRSESEAGFIIRFNLDAVQRADMKTRSDALKIQREAGVINANEWREMENRNPISDDEGGEDYITPMNMSKPGDASGTSDDPPRDQEAI